MGITGVMEAVMGTECGLEASYTPQADWRADLLRGVQRLVRAARDGAPLKAAALAIGSVTWPGFAACAPEMFGPSRLQPPEPCRRPFDGSYSGCRRGR
jgi:hypothetical protein